ncbi:MULTISPECIES: pseudouridine synthase [unclassified Shewanella]|jgi:16S rRNA pseudouridine516 synthase|uniref:pseudouridine synthase n=1 Tax=unclassified Shewanella TaxID=196818 RepID=UPI001601E7E1|nr:MULTISPECIES: pseudouridine synthase [unclassified Shewanella]MBB1320519.1 pseudouridine synthase [Shewanella sp. SR43-8]MBB1392053.1 pseudouridine synthase [Shewanella sp. SG44-6]|tara:strand:- start:3297 stop:3986 length:690 start_codon:yes stop_codon:yes gene_type:complete
MRLDRFVCKSTELLKCDAIQHIHNGEVCVNGVAVRNEAVQVHENNQITLKGQNLTARAFRYLLINKPANMLCSNVDGVYPSIFSLLDVERLSELHIAGRLDADTTGLVLITDDGRWTFAITSPSGECHKVYRVKLAKPLVDDAAERFLQGIALDGEQGLTLPAVLQIITAKEVLLTLTEGKFHQVKRMFAAIGNKVLSLHRESIGAVNADVEVGQWRYLTDAEVKSFNA